MRVFPTRNPRRTPAARFSPPVTRRRKCRHKNCSTRRAGKGKNTRANFGSGEFCEMPRGKIGGPVKILFYGNDAGGSCLEETKVNRFIQRPFSRWKMPARAACKMVCEVQLKNAALVSPFSFNQPCNRRDAGNNQYGRKPNPFVIGRLLNWFYHVLPNI